MRHIDALFICTTPYQIVAAISLKNLLNISADIYITDQQLDYKNVVQRVESLKIFDAVRIIPWYEICKKAYVTNKHTKPIRQLLVVKAYCYSEWVAKRVLIPDTEYKEMYVSCKNLIGRIIWLYYVKYHHGIDFYYYDDGEGSYRTKDNTRRVTKGDALIRMILFGKRSINNNCPQYLFSPEFYYAINGCEKNADIRSIPNIWRDPTFKDVINRVFSFSTDAIVKEDVIFLDTIRTELNVSKRAIVERSLNEVLSVFGRENVIIKRHPRDKSTKADGYKYYHYNGLPFESICLNSGISSKLLIAVGSTSAVTPKLLLDKEPYVIVLNKLIGNTSDKSNRYYSACKELYTNPNRFVLPENIEELKQALLQYQKEQQQRKLTGISD